MSGEKTGRRLLFILLVLLIAANAGFSAVWTTSSYLHHSSQSAIKDPRLFPAASGGFHASYKYNGMDYMSYRRYYNGTFSSPYSVPTTGWLGGGSDICEAGNGDVWVTWENWVDNSLGGQQIWAAKTSNGGPNWTSYNVTNYVYGPNEGGQAKNPNISPYGPAGSSTVISCTHRAVYNQLMYGLWNGSSWSAHMQMGTWSDNFYASWGVARHPIDGSVYRTYGRKINNVFQICMRKFNGSSWEPEIVVSNHTDGFPSRPSIAINKSGWIMVVWDMDGVWCRLYNPDIGWLPMARLDDGFNASVTALHNRNEFYVVYSNEYNIFGRRFRAGSWESSNLVSVGQPSGFTLAPEVISCTDGLLVAAWENHASGGPYAFYSMSYDFTTQDPTPPTPPASITDDGTRTDFTTDLHFTWTAASDPQSGIERYEYSIGTAPGSYNVRYWSYAGNGSAREFTASNLELQPGTTYYINLRAVNNGGQEGPYISSDGILCDPQLNEISFGNTLVVSETTGNANNPNLAVAGDGGLHLVYQDETTLQYKVAYRKMLNGSWSPTEYPGNASPISYFPDVAEDYNGVVHVIFNNPGGREYNNIYECIKVGGTWSSSTLIAGGSMYDWYPRLISGVSPNQVHLMTNFGDTSTYNVGHAVRTAAGWSPVETVGSGAYVSHRYGMPDAVAAADGSVHSVWCSSTVVRYAKRTGTSWSTPVNIANHPGTYLCYPRIAIGTDGVVHVIYSDHIIGPDHPIYYLKQTSPGVWTSPTIIANGQYPSIAVDKNNRPHIVYGKEGTTGSQDIYHKYFNGYSWTKEQNISGNPGSSDHPIIKVTPNGDIHVIWKDNSQGTYKIYYRKSTPPVSCGIVKQYPDGTMLELKNKIVTAIFSDINAVYVEEPNRTSGIRVSGSSAGLALGDKVNVLGTINTIKVGNVPSERYIGSATITKIISGEQLKPVFLRCKDVGGATIGLLPGVMEGTDELGVGQNNIGLLVKIAGKVTKVLGNTVYVDDGSDIDDIWDGTGFRKGVLVQCASTPGVSVGDMVSVTGIVQGSVPNGWYANRRFIRCRTAADFVKLHP